MLIARNRQTSLAPLHLLASVVATVPHPAENCGSIENPRSPLTDDHRVLLCHAIAHASDHTFARICLAHATGGRSCKHCPNEGIREAACAMSNPCAQHSSRLPAASVESGEVAHHGAALGFKQIGDQCPFSVGQAVGIALFRQLTAVCFVVAIGLARFGCLKAALRTLLYPPVSTLWQTCRDER